MKKYMPLLANLASGVLFGLALLFIKQGMNAVHQDTIKFLAFRFTTGFIVMTLLVIFGVQKLHYQGKPVGLSAAVRPVQPHDQPDLRDHVHQLCTHQPHRLRQQHHTHFGGGALHPDQQRRHPQPNSRSSSCW